MNIATANMSIEDRIATEFLEKLEAATGREVYMVEWQATDQPIVYFCDELTKSEPEEELTEEELDQQAQEELYRDEWSQYMEGKPPLSNGY
jgi:hypothetical protein